MVQTEMGGKGDREITMGRVYKFEFEKMKGRKGLVKTCMEWRRGKRQDMKKGKWRIGKQKALAEIGLSEEEIESLEQRGGNVRGEIVKRIGDIQKQEREMKIRDSKFNPLYKDFISTRLVPLWARVRSWV